MGEYEDWQQRVIDEEAELHNKIQKLQKFLLWNSSKADPYMEIQLEAMLTYQLVLNKRIQQW